MYCRVHSLPIMISIMAIMTRDFDTCSAFQEVSQNRQTDFLTIYKREYPITYRFYSQLLATTTAWPEEILFIFGRFGIFGIKSRVCFET